MARKHIKELAAKLHFLTLDREAQKINECSGVTDLANRAGLPPSTLKTLKSEGNADQISIDHEEAIANACAFDAKWPEWRTGTTEEFKERYLRDAKPKPTRRELRRTGIPLTPHDGEQQVGGRLASLKMRVLPSNSSEQWPIRISLCCRTVDGHGIKRGFIDLDCGEAKAPEDEWNFRRPFKVDGANATVRTAVGTERKPSWSVEADSGILDDDIFPNDAYCIVRELAPGDIVTATFSIYVKDIPGPDEYVCQRDGTSLGRNKKAILNRIAAQALSPSGSSQVVLGRHEITFEDAYAGLPTSDTDIEPDR